MDLWLVADSHVERHAATGLAVGEGEALREKACDVGAGAVGGGGQIADPGQVGVGVVDLDLPAGRGGDGDGHGGSHGDDDGDLVGPVAPVACGAGGGEPLAV